MSMKDFVDTLNEEQKKALLDALTSKEVDTNVQPEPKEEDFIRKNTVGIEEFTMNTAKSSALKANKRREPVKARENLWKDSGEHKNIKTPKTKRTPRTRPSPVKKDVVCSVCGKKEKINSNFVYGEFYRCNECIKR